MCRAQLIVAALLVGGVCFVLAQEKDGAPPETTSPEVPQRVRVSQGVTRGFIIRRVQPEYPKKARRKHVQGSVVLRAVIGTDGNIKDLNVVTGDKLLVPPAVKAVRQWKYKPYTLKGKPVEVETQITVIFSLSG